MTAEDYDDDCGGTAGLSRWLLPAFLLSLLAHGGFLYWAHGVSLAASSQEVYDRLVPRTFRVERVEIDQKLLEPEPAVDKKVALAPQAVSLPQEKMAFEKLMAETKGEPAAPKIDQSFLSDKPSAASTTLDKTLQTAQLTGAQSALEDPKALEQALLGDRPDAGSQRVGDLLAPDSLTGRAIVRSGQLQGGDKPGYSNLDDLLAQTGPLSPGTAPILMPSDLLFEYGEYRLTEDAMAGLRKLGLLIRRNPQADFLIEGHTDSFGSEESNLALSQDRATMVKIWLVREMQIAPERIETRGFGESRLIAPGSGTQEEQQINRRVEIVIKNRDARGN
jgi:outer membrane protein OmpA-like peptidoglycan-associated protein